MNARVAFVSSCLLMCGVFAGCSTTNSTDANRIFVNNCADSDVDSKSVLYFGPSNHIGPGSIWSRLGPNGGYQPQWRIEDLKVDKNVVAKGQSFKCEISQNSKLIANGGLSVTSDVARVSGELKNDLSRAKSIKVSSTGAAWDTVVIGPYNQQLKAIVDQDVRKDVQGANRLLLRRALRLDGYKAVLDFDSSVKPEIKAKYSNKLLGAATLGEVGGELSANWTNDGKLELTATDGVYVAGEFAELVRGEWASTRGEESIPDLGDKYVREYQPQRRF